MHSHRFDLPPAGKGGRTRGATGGSSDMDVVTILVIVVLVLLAIYLAQRVF
jgi:hypothetical protein